MCLSRAALGNCLIRRAPIQHFLVKRFKLDELFICYLVFYFYTKPDTALKSSFLIHETHFDMFFSSFHCTVRSIQDKHSGILLT